MRLSSYLPVATAMVLAAGLSIYAATLAVVQIELRALSDVTRIMGSEGFDWAEVRVDGLQVILRGTAPDEATRFAAIATAGSVVDATRIRSQLAVTPASQIVAPEFSVEILRNDDGVSLIGLIPATYDHEALIARVGAFSEAPVTDLLEFGDYDTPASWDAAMGFAIDALSILPRSKVSVTASRITVIGNAASEGEKRGVETALSRAVPSGVDLELNIAAPRPVIAPFTTRFRLDAAGAGFDACVADTSTSREAILSAALAAGLDGQVDCEIGLGAPSLYWGEAVSAGIASVAAIGAGTITFSDSDISLVAPHDVGLVDFDREVGELERALPDGFSLTAVRSQPLETDNAGEDGTGALPEFRATLTPEGAAELRGRLPSERTRTVVQSYAEALFGADNTDQAARLDADLPAGWALRAMAALDALSYLGEGRVVVRGDSMEVAGLSGRADAASAISGLLSERLPDGAEYRIDVTYEETLDPLAGLPTPEECVRRLNTVLSVQKVTFEPGSAEIDEGGLSIIDQLAEILKDCQTVAMEIGGHTDSQGREVMNERLSQERANAVLTAIMDRRILTSNLTAKGYGESRPIAENDSEAGREANRRIEFTLQGSEDETAAEVEDGE
ncbi:MAG: OmpA family protein [Pseudomonadota bacterium]